MSAPFDLPNEEQQRQIRETLSISEDRHRRTLEVFKQWLQSEPHLPDDVDDSYLSQFLSLCKDDLTKAKRKFEINIISRKGLLCNMDFLTSETLKEREIARQFIMSPKLTDDGYRVFFGQFPKSAKSYDFKTSLKYLIDIGDVAYFKDSAAGAIFVGNFENCSLEIVTKIDLVIVSEFMRLFVSGSPSRLKHSHTLNLPASAKPLFSMVKSMMPEKLKNRVIVHDNIDNLKKYLPEDQLPVDYGGTMPSLDELSKTWEKFYVENEEWKEMVRKLRLTGDIPKSKLHLNPSAGFGTDGTFRNLQVD